MHPWFQRAMGSAIVALLAIESQAQPLSLASVFGDRMVLQRDAPVRIWGNVTPAQKVVVSLADKSAEAVADAEGKWQVELPPLPLGKPLELSIRCGQEALAVHDVLMGDLWLCSGQSNMQFTFGEAIDNASVLEKVAADASLRLLMIPKAAAEKPADSFKGSWTGKDLKAINSFAAVGIYFAATLREHDPDLRDVPIGLIDSSFGGTRVEGWIPSAKLAPFKADDLHDSMFGIKPTQLYNAMIAPLAGMRIKGVLWYQGESNTAQATLYPDLLRTMIGQWREDFRDPVLPFYLVQLANYPEPWETYSFAWLRDAQAKVAKEDEHVHLAVAIDTPDGYDLHPRHKSQLGDRLARLAARYAYGKEIVAEGPRFRSATADGDAMCVLFDVGSSPLLLKEELVDGFDLAGEDGVYYSALASRVDDQTLRVSSDRVRSPRTLRYAWRANPAATVFNRDGLPAEPFRTDSAPESPMCEVQQMRPARRVITPNYSARIEADGRLASLMVNGQELLNTDEGGGFLPMGAWGARPLLNCHEVGPNCVRYFDRGAAITYSFTNDETHIEIDNDTNEPLTTRLLLSRLAELLGKAEPGKAISFARDRSGITIEGADAAEQLFGVIYQVKTEVKPHEKRELILRPTVSTSK